jgi:hypothetical protein
MAKKNAVARGRGVMYEGQLISPKLFKKKLAKAERETRKQESFHCMSSYGVERPSKHVANNIMYLYSNGLINV